jgi:hypothetical protein
MQIDLETERQEGKGNGRIDYGIEMEKAEQILR